MELQIPELQQVGKILPYALYWYETAQTYKGKLDIEFLKNAEIDKDRMELYLQLDLERQKTEAVKPSFLQEPIVITAMVILAGAAGIWIGAQF